MKILAKFILLFFINSRLCGNSSSSNLSLDFWNRADLTQSLFLWLEKLAQNDIIWSTKNEPRPKNCWHNFLCKHYKVWIFHDLFFSHPVDWSQNNWHGNSQDKCFDHCRHPHARFEFYACVLYLPFLCSAWIDLFPQSKENERKDGSCLQSTIQKVAVLKGELQIHFTATAFLKVGHVSFHLLRVWAQFFVQKFESQNWHRQIENVIDAQADEEPFWREFLLFVIIIQCPLIQCNSWYSYVKLIVYLASFRHYIIRPLLDFNYVYYKPISYQKVKWNSEKQAQNWAVDNLI